MKTLCSLILFAFNGCFVFSQTRPFHLEPLSEAIGLSQSTVECVYQDSRGYLWIGTQNGLNRYDGYSIKIYKRNFSNENCISNNFINSIFEDANRKLWIATNGGLDIFDPDSEKFRQFTAAENDTTAISGNFVRDICQDHQGRYWVATRARGLDLFDPKIGRLRNYEHDSKNSGSLSSNALTSLCIDIDGNLWIGTWGGGLNRFDHATQSFVAFKHDPNDPNSITSNYISKLKSDSSGNIWVATQGGLSKLNARKRTIISYENIVNSADSNIYAILPDHSGNLWLGTSEGLGLYDLTARKISDNYLISSQGFGNQKVTALFCDRSGIIWIGSERNGLLKVTHENFKTYKYDPAKYPGFLNNNIWSFYERADGNIWIGTDNGVFLFDPQKDLFTPKYQSVFKTVNSSAISINALFEDDGILWAGTPFGLLEINIQSGEFVHYRSVRQDSKTLSSDFVLCLKKDRAGYLWIGTSVGLNRMDTRSKTIVRYVNSANAPIIISDNLVLSLYEDRTGVLWAGTMKGLNRYDPKLNNFYLFEHDTNNFSDAWSALSVVEDKDGLLWVGTGSGISILKPNGAFIKHIDEENGLPDNVIYGVLLDDKNNLWMSSNRGISKIDRKDLEELINAKDTKNLRVPVKTYDKRDGLQGNEFNSGAFLKTKSKEMYFGGINGFSRFDARQIEQNKTPPSVLITSVKKFDKEIKTGPIELRHNENVLTFEFIALDFTDPVKNQYAYKLEGVDNEWNYSTSRRYATYSNLNPGAYRFFVKASNNDLVWSDSISLRIVIDPPYWQTWWFYALTTVFVFSIAWSAHKYRVKTKIRTTLEIERIRRLENERVRKKASDDFHDEFGHTLTKIAMLAEVLKRELQNISAENTTTLQKIIETSKRLSTGMRDFLWALNPEKDTFREVAIRIKDFGDELFDRTNIDFFVDAIPEEFESYRLSMHIRRHIILIFKEAMHNVLKHAESKKSTLSYQIKDQCLEIILTDDGKGLNQNEETPGLGIRSMRRRAKEINGTLNICSRQNEGTTVQFRLPISSTQNTI